MMRWLVAGICLTAATVGGAGMAKGATVTATLNGLKLEFDRTSGALVRMEYPGPGVLLEAAGSEAGLVDAAFPLPEFEPLRLGARHSAGATVEIAGDKVTIRFTHTEVGLAFKGGDPKGFALAGADRQWHWASATTAGDTVIVSSPNVTAPVAVRYAWGENPDCNLYNGAGLPASPFRTDDW